MWRTGLVAPRHVGSSQTRARTRVPCVGRRIINHCATKEALVSGLLRLLFPLHPAIFLDLAQPTLSHHLGSCSNTTSSEALPSHPDMPPGHHSLPPLSYYFLQSTCHSLKLLSLLICARVSVCLPPAPTFVSLCTSTPDTIPGSGRLSVNECSMNE